MKKRTDFETEEDYKDYLSKPFPYFSYDDDGNFELHQTAEEAQRVAKAALERCSEEAADYAWSETVDEICWGQIKGAVRQTLLLKREECDIDDDDYDSEHNVYWSSEWDWFAKYELLEQ